jgi:hypothetical protein
MTTAAPSTALATIQPAFTDPERLALAGFLVGYRGLTREAYALDLRQFTTWCRACSLPLFAARRADIESFARELEVRGRARTTVTRRLCTWTDTRPTSWPPTSRVPPGNPRGLRLFRLAAMAVRRKVSAVIGHGPQPQSEREPPIGTARCLLAVMTAAGQNRLFGASGICRLAGPPG